MKKIKKLLTIQICEQGNGNGIVNAKPNKKITQEELERCFIYILGTYITTYKDLFTDDETEYLSSIVAGISRVVYDKPLLQTMAFCLNDVAQLVEEEEEEHERFN